MKPGYMSLRTADVGRHAVEGWHCSRGRNRIDSAPTCVPSGELRGDAKRGAPLHLQHCAACHGIDGKSEVIVMHIDEPPKDQSDPVYMKTLPDEYLYLVICKGGAALGKNFIMPEFSGVISDQDIRDLIAWIRTFSGT